MTLDIVDLREFYISALGRVVRRVLRARLGRIWPAMKDESVLALGYATPLLRPWLGTATTMIAMMPGGQGVAYWPREGPNCAALADLDKLPLPDESFSRVVLLHALEVDPDPEALLREVWRVLKPNGQALLIVPNRRGLWAHGDETPFGTGRPYSATQLRALLRDHGFLVERAWRALYFPPWHGRLPLALSGLIEKIGSLFAPHFGGVHVMEAGKQIYAPTAVGVRAHGRRLILPMPFPAASGPLPTGREAKTPSA